MIPLTEVQINTIQSFIKENEPGEPPVILSRDVENIKDKYISIIKADLHSYVIAGSNPNGFRMYTMYKSIDNNIYIFTSHIEKLTSYFIVTEEWINNLESD